MEPLAFVPRSAPLPTICFKCGTSEGLSLVPFHFHVTPDESTAEEVAGLAGNVVSALGDASSLVRLVRLIRETKEATLPLPLCASCAARWKTARRARFLAWVPGFAVLFAFIAYTMTLHGPLIGDSPTTKGIFVVVFAIAAWVLFSFVPGQIDKRVASATCGAVAISPAWVALVRVHPRAIVELETVKAPPELLDGLL